MNRTRIGAVACFLCFRIASLGQTTNCNWYSQSLLGPYLWTNSSSTDDASGSHGWTHTAAGSCTYSGVCQWELREDGSPVIIDTKGVGFQFSDPTKGDYVTFDLKGNGTYKKYSWPKHDSGNAWLVLDRDGDGVIKDGTELFGNFTPHSDGGVPNHPNPNGFLALDWYDQPQQGGDGNLILDAKDAIWPKLKLWIDDHCYKTPDVPCQSLPQELHTLESEGVTSISMVWGVVTAMPAGTPTPKVPTYGPLAGLTDLIGNQYKYYTVLNPDAETTPRDEKGQVCCDLHQKSHDGRWAIDVWPVYVQ